MGMTGREPEGLATLPAEHAREAPAAPPLPPSEAEPGVTWRSVLLSLLLMPLNIWWVTVVEVRWYTLYGTCLPLFITPVFFLFVLVLANRAFAYCRPRAVLTQGELLVVYVALSLSCVFAGHDMLQNLIGAMGHAYWHAKPENHWTERFLGLVPTWLFVTDPTSLNAF